jgi:hypothetical protein
MSAYFYHLHSMSVKHKRPRRRRPRLFQAWEQQKNPLPFIGSGFWFSRFCTAESPSPAARSKYEHYQCRPDNRGGAGKPHNTQSQTGSGHRSLS